MTRIRFTKFGACTAFGEFGPGTIARLPEALARHLVDDLHLAEYLPAAAPTPPPPPAPLPKRVIREDAPFKGKRR